VIARKYGDKDVFNAHPDLQLLMEAYNPSTKKRNRSDEVLVLPPTLRELSSILITDKENMKQIAAINLSGEEIFSYGRNI